MGLNSMNLGLGVVLYPYSAADRATTPKYAFAEIFQPPSPYLKLNPPKEDP